ncbi:MAG: hypothetical protein M1591_06400 [Deltaproteobacteria bacterium]|nr:hypothetical protein [Deltaproteobacteria bacterium]
MKVEIETTKITNEQAADALTRGTKRVTHDDLKKVLDKSAEIEKKFKNHGSLSRFIEDLKLLFSLAKDYMNGTYRINDIVQAIFIDMIYDIRNDEYENIDEDIFKYLNEEEFKEVIKNNVQDTIMYRIQHGSMIKANSTV